MTDVETLSERVRTVERAVTDGNHSFPEVDDLAELTERLDEIERRLDELEERTAEQEAATQALRGYVGNVRSVNERVEQRADTALAAAERLERRLDGIESTEGEIEPDIELSGREAGSTGGVGEPRGDRVSPERRAPAADGFGTGSMDDRTRGETGTSDDEQPGDVGVVERIRSLL